MVESDSERMVEVCVKNFMEGLVLGLMGILELGVK